MATRHSNGTRRANTNEHIPAVAYLRASSDRQETSVPDQRKAVYRYAEANGYHLLTEYVDDGISGDATDKRVAFQRMIAGAGSGTFKAIVVWDQDRFGRFDSAEAGFWIHPLRSAGVRLVSVGEGVIDWSDFTGRLMYSIRQEGKHQFLRDLSRNVLRGQREKALQGGWMGRSPYGYHKPKDSTTLVLGPPEEVRSVQRAFQLCLAGKSLQEIGMELGWNATTVRSRLTLPTYCGRYAWNKTRQGKYNGIVGDELSGQFVTGQTDLSEQVIIENHLPAIVTPQQWQRVQDRLAANQNRPSTPIRGGGPFVLSGLACCGHCGGKMKGRSFANGRVRLVCGDHDHNGRCRPNVAYQDDVLGALLPALQRHAVTLRDELAAEIQRQVETRTTASKTESLQDELRAVTAKIAKAEMRLVQCDDDLLDAVQRQLRSLRQDRDRIRDALTVADAPPADADTLVELALQGLWRLPDVFEKADSATQRETLRHCLERVDLISDQTMQGKRAKYAFRGGTAYLSGANLSLLS